MREAVSEFFEKTGKEQEFSLFQKHYEDISRLQFAIIKISGKILELHLEEIAEQIAFLNRYGLFPIVVHGAGSKLDKALKNTEKKDGLRVTKESDIKIIKPIVEELGVRLAKEIEAKKGGAKVVSLYASSDFLNKEKYGFVGEISSFSEGYIKALKTILDSEKTPIIGCITRHKDEETTFLNVNADNVAQSLLLSTKSRKIFFLTETGGILDKNQSLISSINVASKANLDYITGGMKLKLTEIKKLLKHSPRTSAVITSPKELLKELFTIKGSGTYIKNHDITHVKNWNSLEKERIRKTLEDAFGKTLEKTYFNETKAKSIFYSTNYEAIAVVRSLNNYNYLCKYAVKKLRKGTGLGKSLWESIIEKHPCLLWRSAKENPTNGFYVRNCTGMIKKEKWILFWKGYKIEEVLPMISTINSLEETFLG